MELRLDDMSNQTSPLQMSKTPKIAPSPPSKNSVADFVEVGVNRDFGLK
jgi:hypothetical protein